MSYHTRRILPLDDSSRKRKDRDAFYSKPSVPLTAVSNTNSVISTTSFNKGVAAEPGSQQQMPNPLLAGYMAYEFLTKGTLLGQKFDPARAKAVPVNNNKLAESSSSSKRRKDDYEPKLKPKPGSQSYVEVASFMGGDGTHIPGIVNPTQLAQWIQM